MLKPLDPTADPLNNLQTCAHLSAATYLDLPEDYGRFAEFGTTAIQVFASDAMDVRGFVARANNQLILAFRGSSNIANWLDNLQFAQADDGFGGRIHAGFRDAFVSVIDKALNRIRMMQQPGDKLWITGHSLGGALALLAGWWLSDFIEIPGVLTFGQPRVGNPKFAEQWPTKVPVIRVVNDRDIVPQVPLRGLIWSYQHVGELYWFDENGTLSHSDAKWSKLVKQLAMISISRDESVVQAARIQMFDDHSILNYTTILDNAVG